MQPTIISLTKFCKDNSLTKSNVHKRCGELGIDTTNGLTSEAVELLRVEFDLQVKDEVQTSAITVLPPEQKNTLQTMRDELLGGSLTPSMNGSQSSVLNVLSRLKQNIDSKHALLDEAARNIEARQDDLTQLQAIADELKHKNELAIQKQRALDLKAQAVALDEERLTKELERFAE